VSYLLPSKLSQYLVRLQLFFERKGNADLSEVIGASRHYVREEATFRPGTQRPSIIHQRRQAYPAHPFTTAPPWSAQADSAPIMATGRSGQGVVSKTTGKPLIGRSFLIPPKPYHRRTHAARRIMPRSANIISCTTVRRVCILPAPFSPHWTGPVPPAGSACEPASGE